MKKQTYRPSPQQVQWLLIVGFLSVGYALYLRYLGIENSQVGLACDLGPPTWMCKTRLAATWMFRHSVIGGVALAAAVLHFIRPSIATLTVGLAAASAGIVLYNIGLSGLAFGLLILGFARPAPATS
jgi:hypothetical protein